MALSRSVSILMRRVKETHIPTMTGQTLAFLIGYLGFTSCSPCCCCSQFLFFKADVAESSDFALHDVSEGYAAQFTMVPSFEALAHDNIFEAAERALLATTQVELPVFHGDGMLAGFLAKGAILGMADQNRLLSPMPRAMLSTVTRSDGLEPVLDFLQNPDV